MVMEIQNEKNEKLKIDIIFTFKVEKLDKEYIAYMLNDDKEADEGIVFISEIDIEKQKIKSIGFKEKEIILDAYRKIKDNILK